MRVLPEYNRAGDTDTVRDITNEAILCLNIDALDTDSATASMRDLDFLISSGIRLGVDLVKESPRLEQALINLGNVACTVPRGTVSTYALSNPRGTRQRTFTGSKNDRFHGKVATNF